MLKCYIVKILYDIFKSRSLEMSYVLGISKMLIIMTATISRIVQKVTVRLFILVHFHC